MIFPVNWIPYVDIVVLILVVLFIGIGLYKGFLIMAIELFSLIMTFVLSYFIAPLLASRFDLASNLGIDVGIAKLNELITARINELIWFLIVFLVLMFVFALLRTLVKVVTEIPVLRELNILLGGVFGLLKAYVLILIAIFVLTSPFIKNGKIVLEETSLGTVHEYTSYVFSWFQKPTEFNQMLQELMNNESIQHKDLDELFEWLKQMVGEKEAAEVIGQIQIEEGES